MALNFKRICFSDLFSSVHLALESRLASDLLNLVAGFNSIVDEHSCD